MIIDSYSTLLFLSTFIFFLLHYLFFLQRIHRGLKNLRLIASETIPHEFVSIIIPFRNEKENILENLKSIESQLYPEEKFEVIYVNDSSEDNSLDLLKSNIKQNNLRVLSVPNDFSINAHKKRAVRFGIENAKGMIIVTTDADCIHDEEWLKSLVLSFDSVTGFVSGPVEFEIDNGLFRDLGLRKGAIILSINNKEVSSAEDVRQATGASEKSLRSIEGITSDGREFNFQYGN